MEKIKMFDLPCYDGHKSFYGKAVVLEDTENGVKILHSYGTVVAKIDRNGVYTDIPVSMGGSRTTNRHKRSFCIHYGITR